MATVGTLIFEMSANVARLQQDMSKAQDTVKTAMDGIQSAVGMAKTALGALGVATTAAGFVSMIEGAIGAMNALHELSLRTGATVEALSALRGVAKQSGTDMDQVATGLQKLSKNMLEAEGGTGKAAGAFAALGIQIVDGSGKLRASQEVMQELGTKLSSMEDKTMAVAFAQQIMGKAGANLLPFLQQLSEAGTLNAKVTTEQAEAAHKFEANLVRLQTAGDAWKRELANEIIPSMNTWMEQLLDATKRMGSVIGGLLMLGTLNPFRTQSENMAAFRKDLADLAAAREKYADDPRMLANIDRQAAAITARLEYLKFLQRQEALESGGAGAADQNDRALARAKRFNPKLPGEGGATDDSKPSYWTARDEAMFRMAKEAAKELDAIEKERAKSEAATAAELARQNATLDAQAQRWKDIIDPIEPFLRQMDQLNVLFDAGRLSVEQYAAATAKVQQSIDGLNKVKEVIKDTNTFARDMGLTFVSAFENAALHGKNFSDVLKGLDQDIARIILRKSITEPAGKAISDGISGSGIGDWLSGLFGGARAGGGPVSAGSAYLVGENGPELMVPGSSGTVVPNGALGGDTLNVTLNVGSLDPKTAANVILANMGLIQSGIAGAFRRAGRATVLG